MAASEKYHSIVQTVEAIQYGPTYSDELDALLWMDKHGYPRIAELSDADHGWYVGSYSEEQGDKDNKYTIRTDTLYIRVNNDDFPVQCGEWLVLTYDCDIFPYSVRDFEQTYEKCDSSRLGKALVMQADELFIENYGYKNRKWGSRKKRSERVDTLDPSVYALLESIDQFSIALKKTFRIN